jgi:NAD(P)-dependent dehydrogenase (short-subunit alcohol dehydrogenase family)
MDYGLKEKLVLVTGSTKGIGRAIVEEFYGEEAKVIVHGRSEEEVKSLCYKLGKNAFGVAADLSSAEGVNKLITEVKRIGDPDILVNNAGIFEVKAFLEISDEDWHRFFEVNVMSGVRLSRAFFPAMLKKNWGRIIFISSESAVNIPVEMIHYGMTKTAQLAISRGLAELTKKTGVTVNAVLPGPTMSDGVSTFVKEFSRQAGKTKEEFINETFFKEARPSSLIQRFADPKEVAHMVVYIASALSSATNGAALRVDGGVVKSII